MSDALPLQQAHGRSVRLEISIQRRPTVLCGLGRYADGKLWIDVKDQEGDFTLCVDQSTWDGELLKQGDTFLAGLGRNELSPTARLDRAQASTTC